MHKELGIVDIQLMNARAAGAKEEQVRIISNIYTMMSLHPEYYDAYTALINKIQKS